MIDKKTNVILDTEEVSDVIENVFIPRLDKAIDHLEMTISTDFSMTLTKELTGSEYDIEIDNGDVHAMIAMLSLVKGLCHPLVSYDVRYDESTMTGNIDDAFLAANPSFGTLRDGGEAHMAAAGDAFINVITHIEEGVEFIESETDDQADDLIKEEDLGPESLREEVKEALSMIKTSLEGTEVDAPYTLETGEERTLKINLGAIFTNPIRDIRDIRVSFSLNLIPTIMW